MQSIYLYDEVKIKRTKNPGIEIKTNLYFLPTGKENIAYKAAEMLIEEFHIEEGVHITLNKHIPVAAGMAGGSSNAAAVLYGMNKMFDLKLTQTELMVNFFPINFRPINTGIEFSSTLISVYGTAIPINV